MITIKIKVWSDSSESPRTINMPLDLIDDIEELPLYELLEMNVFGKFDVIYIPQPEYTEKPVYN
jgi:hypothetical protein